MKQRGFTLIELMVVMVLLGLISSIALTTVGGGNQKRELNNEVNRLHAVLRMAAEEAIFSNTEIGVAIEEDLYEFLTYDEEEGTWTLAEPHFLRSYTLPEWISLEFQREGKERKLLGRKSVLDEGSDFQSTVLETEAAKTPDLMLLSSGEVTGFTISMQIEDDADSRIEIKTNDQGEIILPALEQDES
ncbi:MAG: general secretion pathway protein H [Oleiphilaceae bacterium]|jgi:general secretion pathway protein H